MTTINMLSHDDFQKNVDELQKKGDLDGARNFRIEYYTNFALTEQMWIDWLDEEQKINPDISSNEYYKSILTLALKDYPGSLLLNNLYIESASDKASAVQSSLEHVGLFSNQVWQYYRDLNPSRTDEIWKEQLSIPFIDFEGIQQDIVLESMTSGDQFNFTPDPIVSKSATIISSLKQPDQSVLSILRTISLLKELPNFPSIATQLYEHAILLFPFDPTIWVEYLLYLPNLDNSNRSVRFCPKSGLLWSFNAKMKKQADLTGFKYIDDFQDAKVLLSQLCALLSHSPISQVKLIQDSLSYPVFQSADTWIWPRILLDDVLSEIKDMAKIRRDNMREIIGRANQRLDMWLRYVQLEKSIGDEKSIRKVFQEGSSVLKNDLSLFMDEWLAFESSIGGDLTQFMVRLNELQKQQMIAPKSVRAQNYEERTVIVKNIGGSDRRELLSIFERQGTVEDLRVKGEFAFVQFSSKEEAKAAVTALTGYQLNGRSLIVEPHERKERLSLYIHFAASASEQDVFEFIKSQAGTEEFKMKLAKQAGNENKLKGYGFVDAANETAYLKILELNGKQFKYHLFSVAAKKSNKTNDDEMKKKIPPPQRKAKEFHPPPPAQKDDSMKDFFGLS